MSTNLQNLLRESLLNNSYDYDAMHNTLRHTWENSYSYLHTLQKSYIEYEEMHYFSNDIDSWNTKKIGKLYVSKLLEACFDIEYDFIHVCNREEFYHSDYYFTQFTIADMVSHPEIFHKLPIIIIDDKVIWDYKLRANNGTFTITLPFGRSFVVDTKRNLEEDRIIYLDHKIQIMVVDNTFYERITLNRMTLNLNSTNHSISIDTSLLSSLVTKKEGLYCLSIHSPNSNGKGYELGTSLVICELKNGKLTAQLSNDDFDKVNRNALNMYVSVVFINKLHHHILYNGNSYSECIGDECNLFMIQQDDLNPYAMPIPVENLVVLKRFSETGNYQLVRNVDTVELYYPNIYRIKDESRKSGDRYYIYYFYHYAEDFEYTPIHSFFYQFLSIRFNHEPIEKTIDTIYRGTADMSSFNSEQLTEFENTFKKIMEYQYYNHQYGDIDFFKRYTKETGNANKLPVEYKDETIKNWINVNPYVLRDYVLEQDKLYTPVYHLWTNAIDLASRRRTSTVPEMGSEGNELDEECYVFSFRNENTTSGKLLNARIFVDGIFVMNTHQVRHYFTDYFYIPVNMVTNDSYIEIEIFPSYAYKESFNFSSLSDKKEISLFEPLDKIFPTNQDLYFITADGHKVLHDKSNLIESTDATGYDSVILKNTQTLSLTSNETDGLIHVYGNDLFKVTAKYVDGDFEIKTTDAEKPVKFTRLNKFEIQPVSDIVLNKNLDVCISKVPNGIEYMIEEDGYPYLSLIENNFKFSVDYIRIFKNGRLVPRQRYAFLSSYTYPRLLFLDYYHRGDIIYIDITPYRYKEIYYQEELEKGQTLIDLKGVITKPFDIRYYDVYMNGRKLSLNNVFTISPWQITLTNLSSIYNLQIFEKERDWEYFGTNYNEIKYYYTIEDLFNSSFITEEERNEIIKSMIDKAKDQNLNIKPNTNNEDKLDFEDLRQFVYVWLFYFNELMPKTYVNPDRVQFDNIIMEEEYPTIDEVYKQIPELSSRNVSEKTRRANYPDVVALNPDIVIEGKNGKGTLYAYCVGHPEDVSEEFLNKGVVILNDPDIDIYKK